MRNNRLSPADVEALLNGTAPAGRAELEPVAAFVEDLRLASFESAPRPSAALSARLDSASWISPAVGGPSPASNREAAAFAAPLPHRGRVRMIFSWFTGLGLVAKIAIGATVMAVGAVGAGAAQALPTPVQQSFNEIVGTLTPPAGAPAVDGSGTNTTDDSGKNTTDGSATVPDSSVGAGTTVDPAVPVVATDDGTADQVKTDHATAVTQAAHDDSTQGREHGKAVSEAAHQNKGQDSSSDDSAGQAPTDDSTGATPTGDDNGGHSASDGGGSGSGSGSASGSGSSDSNGSGSNSGHGGSKGKN